MAKGQTKTKAKTKPAKAPKKPVKARVGRGAIGGYEQITAHINGTPSRFDTQMFGWGESEFRTELRKEAEDVIDAKAAAERRQVAEKVAREIEAYRTAQMKMLREGLPTLETLRQTQACDSITQARAEGREDGIAFAADNTINRKVGRWIDRNFWRLALAAFALTGVAMAVFG